MINRLTLFSVLFITGITTGFAFADPMSSPVRVHALQSSVETINTDLSSRLVYAIYNSSNHAVKFEEKTSNKNIRYDAKRSSCTPDIKGKTLCYSVFDVAPTHLKQQEKMTFQFNIGNQTFHEKQLMIPAKANNRLQATVDKTWKYISSGLGGGGSVTFVAIDSENSNMAFAQVWQHPIEETTNGGLTWHNAAANAPAGNYSFANGNIYGMTGQNIYKSTDQGATWTQLSNGLPADSVDHYAVSGDTIFTEKAIGGEQGPYSLFYYSKDAGATWQQIPAPSITFLFYDAVTSMATDGTNMYLGLQRVDSAPATQPYGIYAYTPGSSTKWKSIEKGLPTDIYDISQIIVNQGHVYASSSIYADDSGDQIYELNTTGDALTQLGSLPATTISQFAVNGDDIYVGGENMVPIEGKTNGIFHSNDNGQDWTSVMGGDQQNISISHDGSLLAATYSNVYSSKDGKNWQLAESGLGNKNITAILTLANGDIYVGTSDNLIFKSSDNGATWTQSSKGIISSGSSCDGIRVLKTDSKGNFYCLDDLGHLFQSSDGENWQENMNVPYGAEPGQYVATSLDVVNDNIYLEDVMGDGLYESQDQGKNWRNVVYDGGGFHSEDLQVTKSHILTIMSGCDISAKIDVSTLKNGKYSSWNEVYPAGTVVNDYVYNEDNTANGLLIAATNHGIYSSTDLGQNWTLSSSGIPDGANINAIKQVGNMLYADVAGQGLYTSSDNAKTWQREATDPGFSNVLMSVVNNKVLIGGFQGLDLLVSPTKLSF